MLIVFTLLSSVLSSFLVVSNEVNYVTCGSAFKLVNLEYDARLHSHDVQYGGGSGQQSVTAIMNRMDEGSYWQVVERNRSPQCNRGRIIKCGQTLRLLHVRSNKYLHSHHFQSPLSSNYEVSAFGNDGVGDEGDDWQILCDGPYWLHSSKFRLKHISTNGLLYLSGKRYNRPISGQYEVSASVQSTNAVDWTVSDGIFMDADSSTLHPNKSNYDHDEF